MDKMVFVFDCDGGENQKWKLQDNDYISPKCNSSLYLGLNAASYVAIVKKDRARKFEKIPI